MAHKRYAPSQKEQNNWKQGLIDLAAIEEDIKQAEQAGVPNMDALKEACQVCKERIEKLRAAYVGGKR